jgi:uncharacterized protein
MRQRDQNPACPVFDSHTHIFSLSVIESVSKRNGLAVSLSLDVAKARSRLDKFALKREADAAGIRCCLLLPTAPAESVHEVNELFLKLVEGEEQLITAGTLHPSYEGIDRELHWLCTRGVHALKFSSFSQRIDLASDETLQMLDKIRAFNAAEKRHFSLVLDTFYQADIYFGTPQQYRTTPEKLSRIVREFPEIDFVATHMGGLAAPLQEIEQHLTPRDNLYLDTSNAAHLLSRQDFVRLLRRHGPDRILFGTDWPWFAHEEEVGLIHGLLREAGFSFEEQCNVFSGNITKLLKPERPY